MRDQYTFLESLDSGVPHAVEAADSFSYLHVEGNDFRLEPVAVRFREVTVSLEDAPRSHHQ